MTADNDEDIWGAYAKGVKKIHGQPEDAPAPKPKKKKQPAPKDEPLPWASAPETTLPLPVTPAPSFPLAAKQDQPAQPSKPHMPWKKEPLDLRVERNMSLGDVMIEAKLDLHGKTEQDAYDAFAAFVEKQAGRGKRMLLVITGKGADGQSVLRANLPRWCDAPPFDAHVIAVRTAAQHHGGDGAYYVLLRKRT